MITNNQDTVTESDQVLFVVSSDADRSGTLAARVINYLDDEEIPFRFNKSSRNLMVHGIDERIQFLDLSNGSRMDYEIRGSHNSAILTDDINYNQLSPKLVGHLDHLEDDLLDYVKESTGSD